MYVLQEILLGLSATIIIVQTDVSESCSVPINTLREVDRSVTITAAKLT
jgi:hypothetical protein